MKSVLYVGATLMIGASIYGFVDYKQSSHKKEFTGMYSEEKTNEQPVIATDDKVLPPVTNEVTKKAKTTAVKKQTAEKKEVVVPVKPIPAEEKINSGQSKKIEKATVTVTPAKENNVVKKKKKKKLNTKLFSRAPLREDLEEEKILPPPDKAELKKTEKKEQ